MKSLSVWGHLIYFFGCRLLFFFLKESCMDPQYINQMAELLWFKWGRSANQASQHPHAQPPNREGLTPLQSLGSQPFVVFKSYKGFFHAVVGIQDFQSGLAGCGWGSLMRWRQIWWLGLHHVEAWLDLKDLIPKWSIPSLARQYGPLAGGPSSHPMYLSIMLLEWSWHGGWLPDEWSRRSQSGSHNVFHYLTSEVTHHHHFHKRSVLSTGYILEAGYHNLQTQNCLCLESISEVIINMQTMFQKNICSDHHAQPRQPLGFTTTEKLEDQRGQVAAKTHRAI